MGAINRFSKEARPAEFNPMSAEKIMQVPLLKAEMEQEQLAAIEEKRLEMLNVDIAPGDMERVRAEQDRLTQQFDNLVNKVTTEGVGYRTTDAVNKFMKDYNTSTSKSGIIGNAGQFSADRKVKKAEDRKLAIQRGYDMQQWEKLYSAHEARQTSIDPEGNLVSEFQNINLPVNLDPVEDFNEMIKGKIGSISEGTTLGEFQSTNQHHLTAAVDQMMLRYDNEPEYQQVMDDLYGDGTPGSGRQQFAKKLVNAASIALEQKFVEYKQAPLTEKQKAEAKAANDKAQKIQDEKDRLAGQPVLAEYKSGITGVEEVSEDKLAELKTAADADPSGEAGRAYVKALAHNERIKDQFQASPEGRVITKELHAATDKLKNATNPLAEGSYEEVMAYANAPENTEEGTTFGVGHGYMRGTKAVTTEGESRMIVTQDSNGNWMAFDKEDDRVADLMKVKEVYDNTYQQYAGEGNLHSQRRYYSPMSKVEGGTSAEKTNKPIVDKIASDMRDIVRGGSGDVEVVKTTGAYIDDDGNLAYIEQGVPGKAERDAQRDRFLLQGLKDSDIQDVKFALPTDTQPGSVQVTFTKKQDVGNQKGVEVTYTMNLDMKGGPESEWGILMSQGLAAGEIKQTTALAQAYRDKEKYKNVVSAPKTAPANMKYANSDEVVKSISGGEIARNVLPRANGPIGVYSTGGGKAAMRVASMGASKDYTLTIKNVLEGVSIMNLTELSAYNKPLSDWIIKKFLEENGTLEGITDSSPEFVQFKKELIDGDRGLSAFEADSKEELLKIMGARKTR